MINMPPALQKIVTLETSLRTEQLRTQQLRHQLGVIAGMATRRGDWLDEDQANDTLSQIWVLSQNALISDSRTAGV